MEELSKVFPANDFALLGVVLATPLIGAIVNGLFGRRLGKEAVTLMALGAIFVSFIGCLVGFFMLSNLRQGESAVRLSWVAWDWFNVSAAKDSFSIPIKVAFSLDALSATMSLIITGIGFLIHLYSSKYMEKDPGYHRFFAYLNLFIFSMLVLVLGDSLPILFVGWEGVGLCSYLLIGFWFEEEANAAAGKKAFIANRIGDFGLLVAMGLLVYYVGALDWVGLDGGRQGLVKSVKLWPIGADVPLITMAVDSGVFPQALGEWINAPRYVNAATLVGLALFLGCAGKSAQIPLYVWLPDAMAGPTPVSALIHAATMVTAGVYLVCRMSGIFVLSPAAMFTVALVGALTAVFAATIALVQNDIKKVLAYSTVSQLGYMFLGVGVGAFVAGFYHVLTHAFFKACLFLGSGSVIHAMHAHIHSTDASQDMRNMGGLKKYMPVTFLTFAVSWAAIAGMPFTSGFFSKDDILLKASSNFVMPPRTDGTIGFGISEIEIWQWPSWGPNVLYALGAIGAVLTAFYMSRLVIGTFFGEFKGWRIVRKKEYAAHLEAHGDHDHDAHHDHHHDAGKPLIGLKPHESPWQMTAPLVILAAFAAFFGFVEAHLLHIHVLSDWLDPVFARAASSVGVVEGAENNGSMVMVIAVLAFGGGAGFAWWVYRTQEGKPAQQWAAKFPRLHALVYDKWRVDELYEETILGAVDSLADACTWLDKHVVDGIVARATSAIVAASGTLLRFTQTGRVHAYAGLMVFGMVGLGWFLLAPRAEVLVSQNHTAGTYTLTATPGFGYSYRWSQDPSADQEPSGDFGEARGLSFELGPDQRKVVMLEVKNAFGSVASEEFEIVRPKTDMSSGAMRIDVTRDEQGNLQGKPRIGGHAAEVLKALGADPSGVQPARPAQPAQGGDH